MLKNAITSDDQQQQDYTFVRHILESYQFPVDEALTPKQETALMIACYQSKLSIINLLLKHGADPNIVDADGNSAVIHCLKSLKSTTLDALRLLAENKAVLVYVNYFGHKPKDYIEAYRAKNPEEYEDLVEGYDELTSRYYYKVCLLHAFQVTNVALL